MGNKENAKSSESEQKNTGVNERVYNVHLGDGVICVVEADSLEQALEKAKHQYNKDKKDGGSK